MDVEKSVLRVLEQATHTGNRRALALCYNALGSVQYLLGKWRQAQDALEKSIEYAESVGATFGEVLGAQRLALLETRLGQFDIAYDRLLRALDVARASDSAMVQGHSIIRILTTLALNRFERGDLDTAVQYLAEGFTVQTTWGDCSSCDALLYPVAVPIYLASGDINQAVRVSLKAEETAMAFRSNAWTADARYLRGLTALAQNNSELAGECFRQALQIFESLDQPYDVARCLEALMSASGVSDQPVDDDAAGRMRDRIENIYGYLRRNLTLKT